MARKYFAPTKISENIRETPEGYLLCLGVPVARTGEYEYGPGETPIEVGSNGKVFISRDADEVFSEKTIASFEGKPFTIRHPDDFVNPENWKDLACGIMQNVRRGTGDESEDLLADVLITDARAISLVRGGVRELSCGYEAEYTETGDGKGKQTGIVGNHLALVEEGRAGSKYAIKDAKQGEPSMFKNKKFLAMFNDAKARKDMADSFKKTFGMTIDEAMAEEKKEEPAKDSPIKGFDELVSVVKDLAEKVGKLGQPNPSVDADAGNGDIVDGKEGEEKTGDEEVSPGLEARLKKLEEMVTKLVQRESAEESVAVDEGGEAEETGDEDEDGGVVETGDAAFDDEDEDETASRVEILAPGLKPTKDAKASALKASYATKDGKKAIDMVAGGKPLTFDGKDPKARVDAIFIAASELLKVQRANDLVTRTRAQAQDFKSTIGSGPVSPEELNKKNEEFYKKNR